VNIRIVRESWSTLAEYARVPIAFDADGVLDVKPRADGAGFDIAERAIEYGVKDYDELPNEGPESWPHRFDVSSWAFFAAFNGSERVGGAAVVIRSTDVDMLDGRDDLALLWDIRVAPTARHQGVGSALMRAVESYAIEEGCIALEVETQNINVPACRFYMRSGFELRTAVPNAYPQCPDETMLLWYKRIP
jgi:ribosomal protein S18 acetylase RimI-like enzyme